MDSGRRRTEGGVAGEEGEGGECSEGVIASLRWAR